MADEKGFSRTLKVNAGSFKGSVYSQFVGVTVTDADMTLEFVYINPRNKTEGEVVSRVTLPRAAGKGLAETVLKTMAMHEKGKGIKN